MSIVREINDAITDSENESLNIDAGLQVARVLAKYVDDPETHRSIFLRAGRAIADHRVPPGEFAEVLDSLIANRGRIRSRGAYFVACCRRLFAKYEQPW